MNRTELDMRAVVLFCLLLFALQGSFAVQDTLAPTEPVQLRGFNSEKIAEYKADPDYFYEREIFEAPSLWERFLEWLRRLLNGIFGNRVADGVTENLYYILIVLGIGLALFFLRKGGLRKIFYGGSRSLAEVAVTEEDIREMDLPALIAEAEMQGDLRRAIRLHYLLVLRKMVDRNELSWSPEFTDRDYINQIKDAGKRERFTHAAHVFQWVWYGHAEVDKARYETLKLPFVEIEMQRAA